ncbi:6-phosphogluconolactonase [Nesterenkonia alba]|uniref:6-phosphogluconolactonase n=1 Tax=Nesterenkonia alba TaxID=515814 RepID=UPI0003B6CD50|nr:6-phosphogluconolactonase [Nesterenkonia alba]
MSVQVNTATAEPVTEIFEDQQQLADSVAAKLLTVIKQTVDEEGAAHISLTGGGPGIAVLRSVAALLRTGHAEEPAWAAVHFWWGDERLLPEDDPDRNEKQARDALLDLLVDDFGLPPENIHPVATSEEAATPEAGAEMYAQQLQAYSPTGGISGLHLPQFAVMLLGVGPDGHINSLFPGKQTLQASGRTTVGEEDAPSELGPPLRVTLTFDAVHTARRVWLVTAGESKTEAVTRAFAEDTPVEDIPARNARGAHQTVWHLDRAAAAGL